MDHFVFSTTWFIVIIDPLQRNSRVNINFMKMTASDFRNDVVEVDNDALEDDKEKKEFEVFAVDEKMKSPPQDQTPVFNTNEVSMSTSSCGSPTDSRFSKSRDWLSSNKSSEMVNEAFDSGSIMSERTATQDKTSPSDKIESNDPSDLEFSSASEKGNNYDVIAQRSLSLPIMGNRLKTLVFDDESNFSDLELQIDACRKDWIRIVHDNEEKMIALSTRGSLDMGTFEIAETLAATFNLSDEVEIVGLTAGAILTENYDRKLKRHCDIVIPLSFLVSGQLKQIVEASTDTIPAFHLVTKMLGSFAGHKGALATECDVTSDEEVSCGEERVCSDAFIDVMENSYTFTPLEKEALLRFGIGEKRGNILFRAAFRVA